jgi:hypothetical protein
MKLSLQFLTAAVLLAASTAFLQAQPSAHYVPGVEGIKGASLPPPGIYLRDYNAFYFADRLNDSSGDEINGADPDVFIYANVPRLVWITDVKVLGGYLGVDALLPLQYTSVEVNTPGGPLDDSTFGLGDLFAEGTLSWHLKHFDVSFGCGVWMPTGESHDLADPGFGYWTPMLTAGATWYIDDNKKWAVSALNRYEFSTEDRDTDITPGQAWTLEWGVSYAVKPTIDVGVVGYYQLQTTKDSGTGASNDRDQVVAIGPEVSLTCPVYHIIASLRYLYEVAAENRLQGHTVALTLTVPF